jgi:hypothetical protein
MPAVRFIYYGLDPFSSRRIVHYLTNYTWKTWGVPFTLSSALLLTMYWFESVTNASLTFKFNLSRFRIPAYLLCAFLFVVEIVIDGL